MGAFLLPLHLPLGGPKFYVGPQVRWVCTQLPVRTGGYSWITDSAGREEMIGSA